MTHNLASVIIGQRPHFVELMAKKVAGRTSGAVADIRMRRTRKALHEGLINLLKVKPLEEITARDIATESLVGYTTFFRHYASKTELLNDIVSDQVSQLLERALPAAAAADTHEASVATCRFVFENRTLWGALLNGGADRMLREVFIRRALERHLPRVREHRWLPLELGAVFGVGASLDILAWWLKKPDEFTPEQMAEYIDRLVVTPTLGQTSTVPARQKPRGVSRARTSVKTTKAK
jgi:AcrR family transcriptional regulator